MFEHDPMMKKLHELREEEYKVMKGLSFKEREKLRMRWIRDGLKGTNYRIVNLEGGAFKIVKR